MGDIVVVVSLTVAILVLSRMLYAVNERYTMLLHRIEKTAIVADMDLDSEKWPSDRFMRARSILQRFRIRARKQAEEEASSRNSD